MSEAPVHPPNATPPDMESRMRGLEARVETLEKGRADGWYTRFGIVTAFLIGASGLVLGVISRNEAGAAQALSAHESWLEHAESARSIAAGLANPATPRDVDRKLESIRRHLDEIRPTSAHPLPEDVDQAMEDTRSAIDRFGAVVGLAPDQKSQWNCPECTSVREGLKALCERLEEAAEGLRAKDAP